MCIAEDRASCEPALRILLASTARHCPGQHAVLFCPSATPEFSRWLARYPLYLLNPCALDAVWTKYDIKPVALLTALTLGASEVIWIDSDILVARDFRPLFAALPATTIAVTEEALGGGHTDPDGLRARLWGMTVGRVLPWTANTGVVRVTAAHRALLEAWHRLLQSATYRDAQAAPWFERPSHLAGDQEVLTALLASDHFAALPVHYLRRGRHIVQFFGTAGYTVRERIGHLFSTPPYFVHSQGFRPWWPSLDPAGGRKFATLYTAMSPYTASAHRYVDALEDPSWLKPPTPLARLFRGIVPGYAPLVGLPLAAAVDAMRLVKAMKSALRRPGRSPAKPAPELRDSASSP